MLVLTLPRHGGSYHFKSVGLYISQLCTVRPAPSLKPVWNLQRLSKAVLFLPFLRAARMPTSMPVAWPLYAALPLLWIILE